MIHKYKLNGYNIVIDVHSGAVHVVDDLAYDMLDQIKPPFKKSCLEGVANNLSKKYEANQITDCYNQLLNLYNEGVLYSADNYEEFSDIMTSSPIKAMCLHIAHDCNLRCKYCFAATGDFGGGRKLMKAKTAKKAIDFLIENSKQRRNIELDFFGGEPLMNFDVVKQVVDYARSKEKKHGKNFRFTITTNGLLLNDDIIEYINKEMSNVVLSLDGRKQINDYMRPCINQGGSYDLIVKKYKKLVDTRKDKDYYVRGTFTKYNLDFTEDVMHIHELGFDQLSVEPVVSDEQMDYAITQEDIPEVFRQYEKLALKIIDKKRQGSKINFFHFMIDLNQGPCAIKRIRGCGCGNEYVAVTPEGDIYPCHQFVGMPDWKMGNIDDNTFDNDKKAFFSKTTIYDKPECKTCWAKFYCSGGCNANNLNYCSDILTPHKMSCEMQKKRLECAIMIKAALAEYMNEHER